MKRCPKCRRDYNDDSLSFCLDDGSELVFGPGATDEQATAILSEPPTKIMAAEGSQPAESGDGGVGSGAGEDQKNFVLQQKSVLRILAFAGVVAIIVLGFLGYRYFTTAGKHIESIAVLPFTNNSGNSEIDFLCYGMTEALITSLARVPNLSVKARNSVFRYKGRDVSVGDVARDLSVQGVLLGTVTHVGDQLFLRLELVDPLTETVIWSDEYEKKQSDLVSLQSEIAGDVATKLRERLSGTEIQRIERRPTANSEAYQLYLRGRFEWNKRRKESLLRAVDYFKQAIALDPMFAAAYGGLADSYVVFNTYEVAPPSQAYPLARAAAQKALEIDPELADGYRSLAAINEDFDWDFRSAERNYRKSIELDPNNASAHQWFGEFLRILGRFDEAVAEGKRSIELDPVSLSANSSYGATFFYANRCDEAIAQQKRTIELDPTYAWPVTRIADCYTLKGMYDDAFVQYRKAIELSNNGSGANWVLAHYGYALGVSGNLPEARRIAAQLLERQKKEFIESDNLAIVYYGLGNLDATFEELERGYRERSPGLRYIVCDPRYDEKFRSDPRYAELIKKIGLSL